MENVRSEQKQASLTEEGEGTRASEQSYDSSNAEFPDHGVTFLPRQQSVGVHETSMDMSGLAGALPAYGYHGPQQLYPPVQSGTAASMIYQHHPGPYSNTSSPQAAPFAQQIPPQYQGHRMYDNYQADPNIAQSQYLNAMYVANQSLMSTPMSPQYQNYQHSPMFHQMPENRFTRNGIYQPVYGYNTGQSDKTNSPQNATGFSPNSTITTSSQAPAALRGPPRKPRQSGHALWVGNLPPGANIIDLKDHFAREATHDIESVFLISKSNCAFVNYKSEDSCAAAMSRFHDSRFHGVRLVCRLRRGTMPAPSTVNASGDTPEDTSSSSLELSRPAQVQDSADTVAEEKEEKVEHSFADNDTKVKERFFVIKSLTIEDLERSVQTGIWATQSHNEIALNKAFQTAESVYLIFSANKSGEYFGYSRMESAIDDEAAAQIATEKPESERKPTMEAQLPTPSVLPMTIPTPATATAPRGHIIDDSARGTIFWEVGSDDVYAEESTTIISENEDSTETEQNIRTPGTLSPNPDVASMQTTFGKPFKISWQSTDRLPFYRTRGLRNPWNTNREVKIARDGTEIEPSVGRKLIDMFGTQPPIQPRAQPPFSGPFIVGPGFSPGHRGSDYGRGY